MNDLMTDQLGFGAPGAMWKEITSYTRGIEFLFFLTISHNAKVIVSSRNDD